MGKLNEKFQTLKNNYTCQNNISNLKKLLVTGNDVEVRKLDPGSSMVLINNNLKLFHSTITVRITARNGVKHTFYYVRVYREPSNNIFLKTITTVPACVTPITIVNGIFVYSCTVIYDVKKITVSATTADDESTISPTPIPPILDLKYTSVNTITMTVTASDTVT